MNRRDRRIVVLAPYGKNAVLIATALRDSGVEAHIVGAAQELAASIREGAGAAIIEQEALDTDGVEVLTGVVAAQPPWSDFPIILLTEGACSARLGEMASANVSVVERPIRPHTLIAAVRFALRARERQYEIRDHLGELKRAEEALRQGEQRYRLLFERMLNGVARCRMIWDEHGQPGDFVYLNINAAFSDLTGISEDIVGKRYSEVFPGAKQLNPELLDIYGHVVRTGKPEQFEIFFKPLDIWFSITAYRPQAEHFVAIFENITARKRAEEALRQSEERFRALVSASSDVVYRMSPDWTEMRYLGGGGFLADTKTPSKGWLQQYIHPDDQRDVWAEIQKAIRGKSLFQLEHRVRRVDGSLGWTLSRAVPLLDANSEITEWFGAASDITARKQAEEALRESDERLAKAFSAGPDGMVIVSLAHGVLEANESFLRLSGLQRSEVIGHTALELGLFAEPAERERALALFGEQGGSISNLEASMRTRSGELRTVLLSVQSIEMGGEQCLLAFVRDITDRKRMEEALQESESRFRLFMDNSPTIAWMKDEQGRIVYLSRTFESRFGVRLADWRGKTDAELWPEDMARQFREDDMAVLASNRPLEVVEDATNPDGTKATWLTSKFPMISSTTGQRFVAGIGLDITERKRAEQALLRSEKLAVTGRMAATIAHEINNPLAGATNAVYLASNDPTASQQVRETLTLADQELRRAAHITQQTLGFFRETANRAPVALPKLIDEVLGIYARKLKERGITVHCRYNCGPCREDCETCFLVNAGEMHQIISNLLGNGMDALRDNGRLYIRVSRVTSRDGVGQDIHLTMADNGCGIRAEHLKRIFEPFFTTKESVGTGLGLWITQELVRKHNGSIRVRSSKGKGAVFRISIPAMPLTSGGSNMGEGAGTVNHTTSAAD